MPDIVLRDVSFHYSAEDDAPGSSEAKQVTGVRDISVTFPSGSVTVITGASGSGKSTLLKLINGLIPHLIEGELQGEILVDGRAPREQDIQELGTQIGTVFQNPRSQFFTSRVVEELAFAGENAGAKREEIMEHLLEVARQWGIGDFLGRKLNALSGGELQLVAGACAMSQGQDIVLFDEPTSNLSPRGIEVFTEILRELKRGGATIVIAEHRVYPMRGLADQVLVMEDGRVALCLSGDDFYTRDEDFRLRYGLRTLEAPQLRAPTSTPPTSTPQNNPATPTPADGVLVRDLHFSYGQEAVLDIPDAHLPAGQVTALLGANGAGKTTLCRVLIGLERSGKGCRISFAGQRLRSRQRAAHSALVMQDVNRQLFSETVLGEVCLGNETDEERGEELLEQLGLAREAQRHPNSLSGGQKQRLVIANALAAEAQFYVFDEPTSGVDFRHLQAISSLLRDLAARGKTVLVVSHDLEFVDAVADRYLQLWPLAAGRESQLEEVHRVEDLNWSPGRAFGAKR